MKNNRFIDWIRPISQIVALVAIIIAAIIFDFSNAFSYVIDAAGIEEGDWLSFLRVALVFGRVIFSAVIWVVVWLCIRKHNSEVTLNPDNGQYHDHPYFAYLICRYVLGYKQCRLMLVPIPMQFKLVCWGTFQEYIYNEEIHDSPKDDDVKITVSNDKTISGEINLVISDTYHISMSQIPASVRKLTTFEIDRSSDDHTRYNSEELVKKVTPTVRNLPGNVEKINVFAATNPTNTYRIAKEAFSTGGRDSIKSLYVYSQSGSGTRSFETPGMRIY